MKPSEKYTWGIILNITGWLTCMLGVLLSLTFIGACIGIPMMMVGLPLGIWGAVWTYQGYYGKQQEAIAAGIQQGLADAKLLADPGNAREPARSTDKQSSPPNPPAQEDS